MPKNKKLFKLLSTCAVALIFPLHVFAVAMVPDLETNPEVTVSNNDAANTVDANADTSAIPTDTILISPSTATAEAETDNISSTGTYLSAGQTLTLSGYYLSDVIVAAQEITLAPGTVIEGDFIAAAANIHGVEARIKGSARLACAQLILENTNISGNATLFASEITLSQLTEIAGDLTAYASQLDLNAQIGGDTRLGASIISVDNTFSGNVKIDGAQNITLHKNTIIAGDLTYATNNAAEDLIIDSGAQVLGQTTYQTLTASDASKHQGFDAGSLLWLGIKILSLLLVGTVLLYFKRERVEAISAKFLAHPALSLSWGTLILLVIPPLCLLFAITIIGFPLSLIAAGFYALGIYLSPLLIGLILGRMIINKSKDPFWPMALGTVIFCCIKLIPLLGMLAGILGIIIFFGATYLTLRKTSINSEVKENPSDLTLKTENLKLAKHTKTKKIARKKINSK